MPSGRSLPTPGTVLKTAVASVKDQETGKVAAKHMEATDASALQGFVRAHVEPGAAAACAIGS